MLKLQNFTKYIMSVFPIVFLIIMGQALRRSHGHLRLKHLVLITGSIILINIFHVYKDKLKGVANVRTWKMFTWSLFSIFLAINPELIYPENGRLLLFMKALLIFQAFIALLFFGYELKPLKKLQPLSRIRIPLYTTVLSLVALCYFLVSYISPNPIIDVWEYARLASRHLINGENPYQFQYPDLYNGKYELTRGYVYWPLSTYLMTVTEYLLQEVRIALVFSTGLLAFAIYQLGGILNVNKNEKLEAVLLWLAFPVGYFVLEQSWVDGIALPFIVLFINALITKKWNQAAIYLGLVCSNKQYMVFIPIFSFIYVLKQTNFKTTIKFTCLTTLVVLLMFSPFLIWDYESLYQKSIKDILVLGHRDDALTWVAYIYKFYGVYLKGSLTGSIYIITLASYCLYLFIRKNIQINDLIVSIISMYSVVFLFGKQAFCNYYYLLSLFIFLYMMINYKGSNSRGLSD